MYTEHDDDEADVAEELESQWDDAGLMIIDL